MTQDRETQFAMILLAAYNICRKHRKPSMTKDQLLESASSLPKQQRIDLVLDLWDTIDADDTPPTQAQKQELDRRIAEEAGATDAGEDWENLKAKLLRGEF